MTTTLAEERSRLAAFESEARSQAARLGLIVNVGREISGSLNLRYVAEAVGKAALTISGFETVRMWIINEDRRELNLVHDTNIDHGGRRGEHASLHTGRGPGWDDPGSSGARLRHCWPARWQPSIEPAAGSQRSPCR